LCLSNRFVERQRDPHGDALSRKGSFRNSLRSVRGPRNHRSELVATERGENGLEDLSDERLLRIPRSTAHSVVFACRIGVYDLSLCVIAEYQRVVIDPDLRPLPLGRSMLSAPA